MNSSNFKIVIRTLRRNKFLSFLNIAGLSTGLAVVILIFNYSYQEFRADREHKNLENIYVLLNRNSADIPYAMASLLRDQVPGIKYVSMVDSWTRNEFSLKYKDNKSLKSDVIFPDSNFTKIFSFDLVCGDLDDALTTPQSAILTESESNRLFINENPIGKVLSLRGSIYALGNSNVEVKAVIKDLPENSNLQFKAAVSHLTTSKMMPWINECLWSCSNVQNYVLLEKGQDPKVLASTMNRKLKPLIPNEIECDFSLLPFRDVYFSEIKDDFKHGNLNLIYTLGSIAILILLIAAINYINLSIAGSVKRLTEVGVKKIVGAKPMQLIRQFLGESVLISFIAMLFGVFLAYLLTPSINRFSPIHLPGVPLFSYCFWLIMTGCSIVTGMAAGFLPALSFNTLSPISLITGRSESQNHGVNLKRILIVFQFIISIVLIIFSITVARQLSHVRNSDMGFNSENIINIKLSPEVKPAIFKEKLQHNPGVVSISFSRWFPGNIQQHYFGVPMVVKGVEKKVDFDTEDADATYVELMGLKIVQGRNFSDSLKSDVGSAIMNESAIKVFGFENPLETDFQLDGIHKIIGVVKDFNFESLHSPIKPLVIFCADQNFFSVNVKLSTGSLNSISGTLNRIEQDWRDVSPNYPFEFKFIDQEIENLYKSEMIFEKIFRYGSLFAIFISCLGLFGLVLGSTEQRKKEIGIRKVNGAGIGEVLLMLNKDFIKWVAIAFLVATPVAWYAMHKWLENFAYKISLSWWIFALAGAMALGIALLTISWHSWKAATENPIEALRYE